jgi:RNA polymerase sigma-70 factor (ECF subfamily)
LIALEDLQDYHFEPVESVKNDLLDQEILDKIHRAIDCLPTQTKMVFSLAKVQGLKYKEIGELLNIKVKTVDYHVASAIKKISIMLDNEKSHNSDLLLKTFLLLIGG